MENLQRLMGQFTMPEDGEFSEEEMDKYVSGVRVYEDRFEWLLNLSPDAGGGLDDAGSPVYFKKITVTPDDERAWFRMHSQWSKSNKYAELEARIFLLLLSAGISPRTWPCSRKIPTGRRASQNGINSTSAMCVLLTDVLVDQQPDFF